MIALNFNPQSRLSKLATEVKLIAAICLSILILVINATLIQLILLLLVTAAALYGNIKLIDIINYIRIFLPVFAIIFVINLFYYDGRIIFSIWYLKATYEGLYAGFFNLIRFINLLIVAFCFFTWTSPLELSSRLTETFGSSRTRFFQELAMVFFIAMRFLPVLTRERATVKLAMQARGARFDGGLLRRIRMNTKLLLPLFSRTLGQVDDVAMALALKSYGDTYFAPAKSVLKLADLLMIIAMIILTIALLIYV